MKLLFILHSTIMGGATISCLKLVHGLIDNNIVPIIVDPNTMEELDYGKEGMLCQSGKHVFKCYYNDEEKTKEPRFKYKGREYYKTGNMGILDENGYFTLTGRSSRYYIRSDLNKVYLGHIQNVISLIDVVEACCVVPKPDKDLLFTNKVL